MADKKISALTAASTPLDGTEVLPIVQSSATVKVANNDLRPKQIQSNATSGVLQIVGPAAASTRVMTVPNANFTAARTDAAQTFTGTQTLSGSAATNSTGLTLSGTTTGYHRVLMNNTSGGGQLGVEASAGGNMTTGSTAYATVFGDYAGYPTEIIANNIVRARFDTSGNITNIGGNYVPATAAKGIDFTANTPATGMTSQLLNWYEEGAYTPTVASTTGALTSYTASAAYTRIGRSVTVVANVTITNAGTGAGTLTITIPFTANASYNFSGSGRENALTGSQLQANISASGTVINVVTYANATVIATNAVVRVVATYFV